MTARIQDLTNNIPFQETSRDIWETKYQLKTKSGEAVDGEIEDTYSRVAEALASVETARKKDKILKDFLWALKNGAIPAGRIISNAGAEAHKPSTSTINCTVSGTIHDSMDNILVKNHEAGLTLKAGCVAPETTVITEHGVVTAQRAATEQHEQMLSYDRENGDFEMRRIQNHMETYVPRNENIEIHSGGTALKTSVKHPVLVFRDDRALYVRADEITQGDALVHYTLSWSADDATAMQAWFAGAHLGDGSAYEKKFEYKPSRQAWKEKAEAAGKRLVFKIRAAEREVVERYAEFFRGFCSSQAKVVATATENGTPVWDYTVASFEASRAAELIDHQIGNKTGTMQVPAWVSEQPQRHFLPFLAGLIDTDGTVSRDWGSVTIAMQSEAFAFSLKQLLGLFGVHSGITRRKPRSHDYNGNTIHDAGGVMLKISDSEFLREVAAHMADHGKRTRILELASQAGQYDQYVVPGSLREALEREADNLGHSERQTLGFYHRYHRKPVVSRIWLQRWRARFPHLAELIDFARTLRPLDKVQRNLEVSETFYDFTVEQHHNYIAGEAGLMVIHNCGIGYEYSTLRPRGAYVAGAGANTSGPLSFMDIFDRMCFTVSSAGGRRGAQMATFDVHHPDVIDFIDAKREDARLRQFNLSLLITEDFIDAVRNDRDWQLSFPVSREEAEKEGLDLNDPQQFVYRDFPVKDGYVTDGKGNVACRIYRTLKARAIWDKIMSSTYDYAEPGFILIDKVNRMNNNWFCENIRATNPCVTADTRLHTQHGMVRIGDLYHSGENLKVTVDRRALDQETRGTEIRDAVPAFMTAGDADVWRVTTEAGYEIKATQWHDFYTGQGKRPLRELSEGDEILIQSGKGQFGHEGSQELGMILGLITGDGQITNRGGEQMAAVINLWGEEQSLADQVSTAVNAMIVNLSLNARAYEVQPVPVTDRNMVFIRSVLLARALEHYGFTKNSKLQVPEVIWRGSEECVRTYLQALFQCDGTVNVSSNSQSCSVRLASSEPSLLKGVQSLLANFGVFSRIHQRRKGGKRSLPDGNGGSREYACREDHELIIDGESRETFMREVGFLLPAKQQRYQEWVEGKALRKTQRFTSRIRSIEYLGREPVFDTTQHDHNTVIFNGLVTGQCGEQPLPPYGSCLLGSVNLTRFVEFPFTEKARFNYDKYRQVVAIFTRMLDNVVEINGLPLDEQRHEIEYKRRHGMGILGLGSTLAMLGMPYGSPESVTFTEEVNKEMALEGWREGIRLADEKGPAPIMSDEFTVTEEMLELRPEMRDDGYQAGDAVPGRILHARYSRYMQRIGEAEPELIDRIAEKGARFTHHTSIAPTGTISLSLANNASNGIEPSFSHHYSRNVIREGRKSKEKVDVFSYELLAYRELVNGRAMPFSEDPEEQLPGYFTTADDVSPKQHVDIQGAAQKWVDSSISKTANVPTDFAYEDFKDIYMYAYEQGLKGCTTFRFNPEAFQGVLVKQKDLEGTQYEFTLEDGSSVQVSGDEDIEYDGEIHNAANLFDALKEGTYGKY